MKTLENDKMHVRTPEDMKYIRETNFNECHLGIFNPDINETVSKHINVYSCQTSFQPVPGRKYKSYVYKIAAGTTPDSVFILRRVHISNKIKCQDASKNGCQITSIIGCEILAFVKNMYPQYILYII